MRTPRCPLWGGGVVLADDKQDLSQSFAIAKEVFERVEHGTIKFVLIGLSPYIIPTADEEPLTAWDVQTNAPIFEEYLKLCRDNGAKPVVVVLPFHWSVRRNYNADVLNLFRSTINSFVKKYKATFVDFLATTPGTGGFQSKYRFSPEGAAAVSALLGEQLYFANVISLKNILDADNEYFNVLKKNFPRDYLKLNQHTFCRMACADYKRLSETLSSDNCLGLMARVFSDMTYEHLANLSNMLPRDDYNDLASRIFEISAEKIRRKDKIKIAFVLYDSSMWCGDKLYNYFAQDERFETTIFLCLRGDKRQDELVKPDYMRGIEQFKQRGLNVVGVDNRNAVVPSQDVIIFLTPYLNVFPLAFYLENIMTKTLITYVPYGLSVSKYNIAYCAITRVAWKFFFTSDVVLKMYEEICKVGMPRGLYGGYPRADIFFDKNRTFQFDWKTTRPDARKIIYAPHWSINSAIKQATFQWNFQFMYEFAKAHPEISWILKPHPNLLFSAVRQKVFPSSEAFKQYLQMWDDLPNAMVYTGAYYQDIFATSDGMIHDSSSFIAEYQYVDRPMIFLTNEDERFNELGEGILNASYTVDGKDLDAIAAMIQRVFIEGDDYKAAERKAVFNKYLNYPKANGMLASEFIYKSIADELKAMPT